MRGSGFWVRAMARPRTEEMPSIFEREGTAAGCVLRARSAHAHPESGYRVPLVQVLEGRLGELRWRYLPRQPPARLRPFVRAMAAYEERAPGWVHRRELPHPGLVMIVELEPAIRVESEGTLRPFGRGFVAGIGGRPSLTVYDRHQRGLQVDLSALGARALFAVDGAELAGRVVGLEELGWGHLAERLAEAPDWPSRFAFVDRAFEERLAGAGDLRVARWLLEAVEASGGQRPIAELVAESGYSHGYLGRLCRRDLGLTPKRLSQLVRFQRLVQRMRGAPQGPSGDVGAPTLARLAAELGYADHSHLVREVRLWSGVAPSELEALVAPALV